MFFSSGTTTAATNRYELMNRAAAFADESGFSGIWTPERHFHEFGGLYPNPSLTSAALAPITSRIQLRAGSLISPLHDSIRIAEEWSVVDNISNGRAAISFGSGWNANDFVFFPDRYADRHDMMTRQIEDVRLLWSGGALRRLNGVGKMTSVTLFPPPVQPDLPIWMTSSGNPSTFSNAGRLGTNVLTHLAGQDLAALADKIKIYRNARRAHGHNNQGIVSVMLHTFLAKNEEDVLPKARPPLREYLRGAVRLERLAAGGGGMISGGHQLPTEEIPDELIEELLDLSVDRYIEEAALVGTPASCSRLLHNMERAGVDEIACLVDFGPSISEVLESLELAASMTGTRH